MPTPAPMTTLPTISSSRRPSADRFRPAGQHGNARRRCADSQMRGQIGETLASLPGVSASSFAPGAVAPGAARLRWRPHPRADRRHRLDRCIVASRPTMPWCSMRSTVDHIDVVHGPALLLFGGQAIGGAVNALDKRIPRRCPSAISLMPSASYGSAADERGVAAAVDAPLGRNFAVAARRAMAQERRPARRRLRQFAGPAPRR